MFSRRSVLRVLTPLSSIVVLATGFTMATAKPAGALTEVTICLLNSTSYCADVKDGNNTLGQPIWIYDKSFSRDYHWYELGGGPDGSFSLEDVQNTSLCLGASDTQSVVLQHCGTPLSYWIPNATGANYLENDFWGGKVLTVRQPINGYLLFVDVHVAGTWQRWTGY